MKIAVICFTEAGGLLAGKLAETLKETHTVICCSKCKKTLPQTRTVQTDIGTWTGEQFGCQDAICFIGAAGIAVRAIAPYVRDKLRDPAVLVLDEKGTFVIPLLSGHVGGANELAEEISEKLAAVPVITTGTDINGVFAVDVFAKKNHLGIANREGIAAVSSALLSGEEADVLISPYREGEKGGMTAVLTPLDTECTLLQLCPKNYVLGIGCRQGKSKEALEEAVLQALKAAGIHRQALFAIASIDAKKNEPGIVALAKMYGLPFQTFSAEELGAVPGTFTASEFVRQKMGVDNVCERAAIAACGAAGGEIVLQKTAGDGITVAIARRKKR